MSWERWPQLNVGELRALRVQAMVDARYSYNCWQRTGDGLWLEITRAYVRFAWCMHTRMMWRRRELRLR